MKTPSRPQKDNSFSSFAIGVSVGVAASFLFGTEEGRGLVKRILDAIPEKYKNIPDPIKNITNGIISQTDSHITPVIRPEETSHHATYDFLANNRFSSSEAPPPPAPLVRPTRPETFKPQL